MIKNEHSDWIENEYKRLKLIQISKENEIVLIFTITDPTLITTNNDLGSTAQSMIIEYSIPLSEFTEVVK